jgi:desulfoferrodoxin ferrous iron-binding domain
MSLSEFVKSADWKMEKHVPAIDAPEAVKAGEMFAATVAVGKEMPHPNTSAHHIAWIALHFAPEGAKTSVEIGRAEFSAHGASADGADNGPAHTASAVTFNLRIAAPGKLYATAYCNLHGLWASEKSVAVS